MAFQKRIETSKLIESFNIQELESLLNLPQNELKHLKKQKHPLKLLQGDIMQHYPFGKLYEYDASVEEAERFLRKDVAPTGYIVVGAW